MISPTEIEIIKNEIASMSDEELEARKEIFYGDLRRSFNPAISETYTDHDRLILTEKIVWVDMRLEGISDGGIKSWAFRLKRRVYYGNKARKNKEL